MSPFRGFSEHILNPKLLGKRLHLSQTVSRNIHLQHQNLNLVVLNKFIFFHPTFFECEFSTGHSCSLLCKNCIRSKHCKNRERTPSYEVILAFWKYFDTGSVTSVDIHHNWTQAWTSLNGDRLVFSFFHLVLNMRDTPEGDKDMAAI